LDLLLENPEIMPTATEEILRSASPVTQLTRAATKDIQMGGKQIHARDRLALFASANRDEVIFDIPTPSTSDDFQTSTSPSARVSFFCVSAHLARLELRLMLLELLPRTTT
jgi:cytochrome P450